MEREREKVGAVYIPLGCRQTSRGIKMASADGLGSWAANCLSVQRGFLEARLHVQLRVDFFGREHVKRVIAATSGLLHINTYAYT